MKTSEFTREEKDNVVENSYVMFQIREVVGLSQMFFKIRVLKNFDFTRNVLY